MSSLNAKKPHLSILNWFILVLVAGTMCAVSLRFIKSRPSVLYYPKTLLNIDTKYADGDSWRAMVPASQYLKKNSGTIVYDEMFKKGIKFQYPLSSLLVYDIPNKLLGASYEQVTCWLSVICLIGVLLFGPISALSLTVLLKQPRFESMRLYSSKSIILLYSLLFAFTFLFYPMLRSNFLGQIQTILSLAAAMVILAWLGNKKILAGILIALICAIKPQLVLLLFWGAIRKEWRMVIAGCITIVVIQFIAIGFYGFNNNLYYLKVLSFLSHHGESFNANQSINGILNRMLFNGDNLIFTGQFPIYRPIIYWGTLISSVILMITGLLWNYKSKPNVLDLCIIILCTTMASPIAWEHHYSIIMPMFIILSPFALQYFGNKKWTLALLLFGYLLVSQYFNFVDKFANTHWNFLQSYLFFGACIILYFFLKISKKVANESLIS